MRRKIAAIMAADVVGYSRMISDDEEETLRRLISYREVFTDFVGRGGGRIFNTAGDAVFAEFPSAVEALRAAIEIQESIRTRNLAFPESRHMRFRIGMSVGDVVEREGDLLGDGVNVAARLEGLAEPGGICISRSVHEQVGSKLSVTFKDIGPQSVKNIPVPVHAFTIPAARQSAEEPQSHGSRPTLRSQSATVGLAVICAVAALACGVVLVINRPLNHMPTPFPTRSPSIVAEPAGTTALAKPAAVQVDPTVLDRGVPPQPFALAAATDSSTLIYGTDGMPRPDAAAPVNMAFSASAVPFVTDANRLAIATDLSGKRNEALALGTNWIAGWSWSRATEGDARSAALKACYDAKGEKCRLFAVNGVVVWPEPLPEMPPFPWTGTKAARTPFDARRIGGITETARATINVEYPEAKLHKALAIGPHYWSFMGRKESSLEAERMALERCGAATGVACRIVAVDDEFVVSPSEPLAARKEPPDAEHTTACDAASADKLDSLKPKGVPGVGLASINPVIAVPACEAAVAASPDDARVRYQLGRAYVAAKDPAKAREAFERAASGDPEALDAMGYLNASGIGMAPDSDQSIAWYRKAVDAGSLGGLIDLGIALNSGHGIPKDSAMAFALWERAVERGSTDAMDLLGQLLVVGAEGVERNPVRASVLFQRAAEAGNAKAAEALGKMYEDGNGVDKDLSQAMAWYRQAEASGNVQASYDVNRLASLVK